MKATIFCSTLSALFLFSANGLSQADPLYRQNHTNALLFNPAQAGANQHHEINALASNSWVGFEGAPRTYAVSGNFSLQNGIGLGFTAFTDQTGPAKHNNFGVNLAKHINLNQSWKLALGLKGGVTSLSVNLPGLSTTVGNDPLMQKELASGFRLDMGWGLLAYSKNFFFGVAQPRLFDVKFFEVDMVDYIQSKGVIAYAGHNHEINETYGIRSFLMYRHVPRNPLFLDFGTTLTINKKMEVGMIYQLKSAVGAFLGAHVNPQLFIGYTYSYPTSRISNISVQSHEIVLRFKFKSGAENSNFVGPRFFN
jgi:type IX secretion system PorP/SprF family membrane protein